MSSFITAVYWTAAWMAFAGFFAISAGWRPGEVGGGAAPRRGRAVYALLMFVVLFLFRWPAFFVPGPLNPDESQFIAGALTLLKDPLFWRSVDGQTAGPLIFYALVPLGPLGWLNYTGARIVGCLMIFGTLWFTYRGLRALFDETLARLGYFLRRHVDELWRIHGSPNRGDRRTSRGNDATIGISRRQWFRPWIGAPRCSLAFQHLIAVSPTTEEFDRCGFIVLREILPSEVRQVLHHYTLIFAKRGNPRSDHLVPGAPAAYGHPCMEQALQHLVPTVEAATGRRVFPTYSYFRVYRRGDVLPRHRDRPACEISLSLSLGYQGADDWPLRLEGADGPAAASLRPGDAVLYKGIELWHWREPFAGESASQVFLHYVDQAGPHAEWRFDKRASLQLGA